jgi:cytochrome c biogenesis protein CcmG, thiol:disulfide interchange protein DsbE
MSESTISLRQIGVVLLISAFVGWFLLPALGTRLRHSVGDQVPDFSLPVVVGGEKDSRQSLQALRGKIVLMDFWASWCGPCRQTLPAVEQLAKDASKKNLVVLGINQGESPETIRQFFSGHDPGYSILSDADGAVSSNLGVNGLPTLVVVDPQGKLRGSISGATTYARLERLVAEAEAP